MTPPMDHEAVAREIVEQHSYCIDTSFGNANELIKSIATALREERARAIEECAKVAEHHAMENGPSQVFTMGGHAIASKLRALKDGT